MDGVRQMLDSPSLELHKHDDRADAANDNHEWPEKLAHTCPDVGPLVGATSASVWV